MTIDDLKKEAGVSKLDFKRGPKGGLYCGTKIGMVFQDKDFNPKKPTTVDISFDNEGKRCYRLTNRKVEMSL